MNIYSKKQNWKIILLGVALIIGVLTFVITNNLAKKLSVEERKKVELWALGMRQISALDNDEKNYTFILEVIKNNETVPVILTDKDGNIKAVRNLNPDKEKDPEYLNRELEKMKKANKPIEITLLDGNRDYIYYKESILLTKLFYFPIIQFGVISLFLLVSYLAFSASRRAEQNRVWVGMAKETAHQLGTPTSSLMASLELLKLKNTDQTITQEFEKDIIRLEKITERFSKIGSAPKLEKQDIVKLLIQAVNYIKARSSKKISFTYNFSESDQIRVPVNASLFEWVIENLCKNAIDSMEGSGNIHVQLDDRIQFLFIDIIDQGKGIPKSKQKTIFQPGYTTKQRGWGLGLSLSKRIIENYHDGRIFVNHSEVDKGTDMRIVLRK
ncbi:MAG TPA: HAMP domain-containing sensor histidine kinase [Bacteroidales bacterium]|nr:HAMP domain-containing sensor histidine kinase [Bacteroidales bacterium]